MSVFESYTGATFRDMEPKEEKDGSGSRDASLCLLTNHCQVKGLHIVNKHLVSRISVYNTNYYHTSHFFNPDIVAVDKNRSPSHDFV